MCIISYHNGKKLTCISLAKVGKKRAGECTAFYQNCKLFDLLIVWKLYKSTLYVCVYIFSCLIKTLKIEQKSENILAEKWNKNWKMVEKFKQFWKGVSVKIRIFLIDSWTGIPFNEMHFHPNHEKSTDFVAYNFVKLHVCIKSEH